MVLISATKQTLLTREMLVERYGQCLPNVTANACRTLRPMPAERYGNVPEARYYDQYPHDPLGPVLHHFLAACPRLIALLRSTNRSRPDP
jgi:hypothetical protein